MDQTYRISYHLEKTGFDIESTDKEWLEEKEKEYLARVNSIALQPISTSIGSKVEKPAELPQNLTINEFYRKNVIANKVRSRTDTAVFFIYYLKKVRKMETIKIEDVKQCFADISYPNYNKLNYSDILNKAKNRALLNYVNGLWTLTITGEDYIVNTIINPKNEPAK
jgi:hypothetical protein